MTYPLGWPVVEQAIVRRERWSGGSKLQGLPLVYPGQEVIPDQPVVRLQRTTAQIPSTSFSIPSTPFNSSAGLLHEASSRTNSSEFIPAGLYGRVVDITERGGVVIESRAAVVQGVFGIGNQIAGVLTFWQSDMTNRRQRVIPPGAILVVPGPVDFAFLRQAMNSGIAGVIASSVSLQDLEGFLGTDCIQLLNSRQAALEQQLLPAMTLLFTEGAGHLPMATQTINLLHQYQGSIALLSGFTSVHQEVPELVISLSAQMMSRDWQPQLTETTLNPGVPVRIIAGDYIGVTGMIDYFFSYEQVFPSGLRARALRMRCDDGSLLMVPTVLVERIG